MGRPGKYSVDFFPHYTDASERKTLCIIEKRHGIVGYAVWFKLLELLGKAEKHYLQFENDIDFEFIATKIGVSVPEITPILNSLAELGAIDPELWKTGIIWSENYVENLFPVYAKRRMQLPKKPDFRTGNPNCTEVKVQETGISEPETTVEVEFPGIPGLEMRQSRVKKSKEENTTPPTPLRGKSGREKARSPDVSGLPQYPSEEFVRLNEAAVTLLCFLNVTCDMHYPENSTTLRPIMLRIHEAMTQQGMTAEQAVALGKRVIGMKHNDPHFQKNRTLLKPSTIFGEKYFEYVGQLPEDEEEEHYILDDEPDGKGGWIRTRKYDDGRVMVLTNDGWKPGNEVVPEVQNYSGPG